MTQIPLSGLSVFHPLGGSVAVDSLPAGFAIFSGDKLHPFAEMAAVQLQKQLQQSTAWQHNFGLSDEQKGPVIGKMFGVLVVRTEQGAYGYLAAFSGKLANGNYHAGFVPPIYDGMAEDGFLTAGMRQLSRITQEIDAPGATDKAQIEQLKQKRRDLSKSLQKKIFDQYHFLNCSGKAESLVDLFAKAGYHNPPAGAGECAAPKLLQYAFQQQMQPIAMAEFWWGLSPKSAFWKHGVFYPPCREKCAPILAHMLSGLTLETDPYGIR